MSENYYKELAKFQKDNGVKTDENLLERKLYEVEILTRWQDPTIEEYKQLIKNWKEKYYQMKEERDKQKELLDKIKEILNKMIYEGYAPSSTGSITLYTATRENSEFGIRAKVILELLEEIE